MDDAGPFMELRISLDPASSLVAKDRYRDEGKTRKAKLMEATEELNTKTSELRAKLDTVVQKARMACERMQEQTAAAAKATDKVVHEHPYPTLGIAFGVGILIGVLVMWGRRD
jgi:ElaB/YqjD/DUF883 family membrane-anchored ribosome-binding protein